MTLNDLLDIAIEHEIGSQKLYKDILAIVNDSETKTFLNELVAEEKRHEDMLMMIKEMELYDGSLTIDDDLVTRSIPQSHDSERRLDSNSSINDVLNVALEREYRAHRLFAVLSVSDVHPEIRQLFTTLAAEEDQHHHNIQKAFDIQKGAMGFEM